MSYLDKFDSIKAFVFDVDGVLTDGQVLLLPDGQQMRQMNSKDGYALQLAVKKGYVVAVITGGGSAEVKNRLNKLGITDVYLSATNKEEALEDLLMSHSLNPENVCYMGDDIPDICVLKNVGLPCCPKDATVEVIQNSVYVSELNGGKGCVRDIVEKVMRVHSCWYDPQSVDQNLYDFTW